MKRVRRWEEDDTLSLLKDNVLQISFFQSVSFCEKEGKLLFALPGRPFAAFRSFDNVVLLFLYRLKGLEKIRFDPEEKLKDNLLHIEERPGKDLF